MAHRKITTKNETVQKYNITPYKTTKKDKTTRKNYKRLFQQHTLTKTQ